jgi:hypothetical protein
MSAAGEWERSAASSCRSKILSVHRDENMQTNLCPKQSVSSSFQDPWAVLDQRAVGVQLQFIFAKSPGFQVFVSAGSVGP